MQIPIWVVSPAVNERKNFEYLLPQVLELRDSWPGLTWLIVDDGSTDDLRTALEELEAPARDHVLIINSSGSKQNYRCGKSAALRTGFNFALESGAELVAMMDIDGQDVPAELRNLASELGEYDLVSGFRSNRRDPGIKRLASILFNSAGNVLTRAKFKDANSGLKIMRTEVANELVKFLHGDFHRYMLVIAEKRGFSVLEKEVTHKRRHSGKSKYGLGRSFRGFFDLVSVLFLVDFENRPLHFLGGLGTLTAGLGTVGLFYLGAIWLAGESIGGRPLLIISTLLIILGLQLIIFGLLAQLVVHMAPSRDFDRVDR